MCDLIISMYTITQLIIKEVAILWISTSSPKTVKAILLRNWCRAECTEKEKYVIIHACCIKWCYVCPTTVQYLNRQEIVSHDMKSWPKPCPFTWDVGLSCMEIRGPSHCWHTNHLPVNLHMTSIVHNVIIACKGCYNFQFSHESVISNSLHTHRHMIGIIDSFMSFRIQCTT